MLLARTDPDRSIGHRGLSMFIVPKLRGDGHGFEVSQADMDGPGAGKMEGRPIDTIGYRGMHSYEVALEDWFVPAENLIGGEGGKGKRLLLPDGRIRERPAPDRGPRHRRDAGRVRGRPGPTPRTASCSASRSREYQLTQAKLARMAVLIQGARQYSYEVARLMAKGEGRSRRR